MDRDWKGAEGASDFLICLVVTWACSLYDLFTSIKNSFNK